jgi:hypothetical protein
VLAELESPIGSKKKSWRRKKALEAIRKDKKFPEVTLNERNLFVD